MNNQEAIEIIKMFPEWNSDDMWLENDDMEELVKIAISAIEKQIPKKVTIKGWNPATCPSCGHELSESVGDGYYRHPTFLEICPKCYQRLDWGDND